MTWQLKWQLRFEAAPLGNRMDGAAWKRGIAMAAQEAMLTKRMRQFDGPLAVSASFRLPRPRSAAKTAKCITRPGGFDLARIVDDGLRGIIYPSTRGGQIVRCDIEKRWVDGPGSVLIVIREVI